jgi:hypothetical protein
MRLSLRSLLRNQFLSEAVLLISVQNASNTRHVIALNVEGRHTAAPVGDVDYLLKFRQSFHIACVHIHTVCEKIHAVK